MYLSVARQKCLWYYTSVSLNGIGEFLTRVELIDQCIYQKNTSFPKDVALCFCYFLIYIRLIY